MIQAALAEDDRVFTLLDKACAAKDSALISIQVGEVRSLHLTRARLAALRADPRFDDLLRRMALDPRPWPTRQMKRGAARALYLTTNTMLLSWAAWRTPRPAPAGEAIRALQPWATSWCRAHRP